MSILSKQFGLAGEKMVKKKLWGFGFDIDDVSNKAPFDLLVNKKYAVEVKYSSLFQSKAGKFYWNIRKINAKNFDILAIVLQMPDDSYSIYYKKIEKADEDMFTKENIIITAEVLKKGFSLDAKKVIIGEAKGIKIPVKELVLKRENWYSKQQVAKLLKINIPQIDLLIKSKKLRAVLTGEGLGKRYGIKGEWIIIYLANKL